MFDSEFTDVEKILLLEKQIYLVPIDVENIEVPADFGSENRYTIKTINDNWSDYEIQFLGTGK